MNSPKENTIVFKARKVNFYGGAFFSFMGAGFLSVDAYLLGLGAFAIALIFLLNYFFKSLLISSEGLEYKSILGKSFKYGWNDVNIHYHNPSKFQIFYNRRGPARLLTIQSKIGDIHVITAVELQRPYEMEKIVKEYQEKYG